MIHPGRAESPLVVPQRASLRLTGFGMDTARAASPSRLEASSSSSGAEPRSIGAQAIEGEAADAFSEGLMGLLTPLVHKCDEGVQAALDSQAALSQQIDRVTTRLSHSYTP